MGLLPQILLGALVVAAFAATMQQRLAIASHANFLQARQFAYMLRTHHQAAINLKQADSTLQTTIADSRILSCITGKVVITVAWNSLAVMTSPDEANTVVEELARQSVLAPELGRVGQTRWSVGYNGIHSALITPVAQTGISDGANIRTGTGVFPLPLDCRFIPYGSPAMVTQVLP